jgi:antitoxin VapB
MALNIKDPETVRLAAEVAALTGESKTRAVRTALQERKARLRGTELPEDRKRRLRRFLEEEVWPQLPPGVRGVPISRAEREQILGIGPEGY